MKEPIEQKEITLLHPEGPNARALRHYLEAQGHRVSEIPNVDQLLVALQETPDLHAVIHTQSLDSEFPESRLNDFCDRILLIFPSLKGDDEGEREETSSSLKHLREPYFLIDVETELTSKPEVEVVTSLASPSHDDLHFQIFGSLGRVLGTPLSSADGWLQLLQQDMRSNDPAQRHISHARREMADMDRLLRLLRMADDTAEPHWTALAIPRAIEDVLKRVEVAAVPMNVTISEDLPTVNADPRLFRAALDALLRGILEPAGRPESVSIEVRVSSQTVQLEIVEEGTRLTKIQIDSLAAAGESLRYNSFGRGAGFPLARRLLERQSISMSIREESGRRLCILLTMLPAQRSRSGQSPFHFRSHEEKAEGAS